MNLVDIKLIIHPNGKLTALDDFYYFDNYEGDLDSNLLNYVAVEFLEYTPDHSIHEIKIYSYEHYREYMSCDSEFALMKDGCWQYHKYMIPVNNACEQNCDSIYAIYTDSKVTFYENDKEISNITEYLRDLKDAETNSNVYYCRKNVFSICKLTKCFVNLQHKIMEKTFSYNCVDINELRNSRDFLLCSIHVLDYLKDIKQFVEAQRILDGLTSCLQICESNSCNCNG